MLAILGHNVLQCSLIVLQAGAQLPVLHLDVAQMRMLLIDGVHHLVVGVIATEQIEGVELLLNASQALQLLVDVLRLHDERVAERGAILEAARHLFGVGDDLVGGQRHDSTVVGCSLELCMQE